MPPIIFPLAFCSTGKDSSARRSLLFLRGSKFNVDSELEDIRRQVQESRLVDSVGVSSLVTKRECLLPTLISIMLMFLQQFSGITAILPYAVQLFEDAGLGETIDSFTCNILVSVTNIVFGILSLALVDRSVFILSNFLLEILTAFFQIGSKNLVDYI